MDTWLNKLQTRFAGRLGKHLAESGIRLLDVRPRHANLLDRDKGSIVYEVVYRHNSAVESGSVYYAVSAESPPTERPRKSNGSPFPGFVPDVLPGMSALRFDLDPVLKGVPDTMQTVSPDDIPPLIWQEFPDLNVADVRRRLIRYNPGSRLTWRYQFPAEGGSPIGKYLSPRVFYVKTYRKKKQAQRAYENARVLAGSFQQTEDRLLPVAPVAFQPEFHSVWYREITGKNLSRAVLSPDSRFYLPQLAEGVSKLHNHPAAGLILKDYSPEAEERRLHSKTAKILQTYPEYEDSFATIASVLGARRKDLHTGDRLLHGTFRANHVLISETNFWLLDMDSIGRGPAEYDLANFVSALYFQMPGEKASGRVRELEEKLIGGYPKPKTPQVDRQTYYWYLAELLFRKQLYKIFRQNYPVQRDQSAFFLDLIQTTISKLQ